MICGNCLGWSISGYEPRPRGGRQDKPAADKMEVANFDSSDVALLSLYYFIYMHKKPPDSSLRSSNKQAVYPKYDQIVFI